MPEQPKEQEFDRKTNNAVRFFEAWAASHADSMDSIGVLPYNPTEYSFQRLNEYKTPSRFNSEGIPESEIGDYVEFVDTIVRGSFKDRQDKAERFMRTFEEPYEYDISGRSFTEVLAEDYLGKGKGVVVMMGHADEGLTDSPRFTGGLVAALGRRYGARFLGQVGFAAAKTIAFETWETVPVSDVTGYADKYWTAPRSGNEQIYRERAGISSEELEEFYIDINLGGGRAIMEDLRQKEEKLGKAIGINSTGTRANAVFGSNGEVSSLTFGDIEVGSARLTTAGQGLCTAAVVNGEVKLGPIIPTDRPAGLDKHGREVWAMQTAEDHMGILMHLVDKIYGRPVAIYHRKTPAGVIYQDYMTGVANQTRAA